MIQGGLPSAADPIPDPDPDPDPAHGPGSAWNDALREALADPAQPRIVFQPIVDLRRGVVAGYEVLARFGRSATPSPDRWFAAADQAGIAAHFEARVLRAALAARDRIPANCFLTVNVMPHLLTTAEVASVWAEADLNGLVLELNETEDAEHAPGLIDTTQALRDRGSSIAMDDVGSGYAGLRQIARIRPDLVKLDRDLVAGAERDQVRRTLTELVTVFAGRLAVSVIAEGVERDEELAMLIGLGVPLGQGWYLGRPAETWQRPDPAVSRRIRLLAQRTNRDDAVGSLLERVRIVFGEDAPHRATAPTPAASRPDPNRPDPNRPGPARPRPGAMAPAIVVNRRYRPVALDLPGPRGATSPRQVPTSMIVWPDEHVADVAHRAMSRPANHRFDPVVVVTTMGRPIGLVRIERMILRLAQMSDASAPHPVGRSAQETAHRWAVSGPGTPASGVAMKS